MKSVVFFATLALALAGSFQHWTKIGAADPSDKVTFHIALKQRNTDTLIEWLNDVSYPTSPNYGKPKYSKATGYSDSHALTMSTSFWGGEIKLKISFCVLCFP